MEDETGYHATMQCSKARALRQGLADAWNLPDESILAYTGTDWVLVLLDRLNKDMRCKIMLIWWRAWHHRNYIIFDKGNASVDNSISFLQNYLDTLQGVASGRDTVDRKGKTPVYQEVVQKKQATQGEDGDKNKWVKPQEGWMKCNVDASFIIAQCRSASMAEGTACLQGLELALCYSSSNLIIETDFAAPLEAFKDNSPDRSDLCSIAREFKLKKPPSRQICLAEVGRNCNLVAHDLCQFGRRELSGGVLLSLIPTSASRSAWADCNQNIVS
jgi:hypothetical protein